MISIPVEIQVFAKQEVYDYFEDRKLNFMVILGRKVTSCLNTRQCPLEQDSFKYDDIGTIASAPIYVGGRIIYQVDNDVRIMINAGYSNDRAEIQGSVTENISEWFLGLMDIAGKTCKVQLSLSSANASTRSTYVKSTV